MSYDDDHRGNGTWRRDHPRAEVDEGRRPRLGPSPERSMAPGAYQGGYGDPDGSDGQGRGYGQSRGEYEGYGGTRGQRLEGDDQPDAYGLIGPGGSRASRSRGNGSQGYDQSAEWRMRGPDANPRPEAAGSHRGKGPKGYRRSDQRILEDVSDTLARDPSIDASEIEVKVEAGEVTLSGSVSDRAQKRQAENCIERVEGVKDVHNQVRVQSPGPSLRSDWRRSEPTGSDPGSGPVPSSDAAETGSSAPRR